VTGKEYEPAGVTGLVAIVRVDVNEPPSVSVTGLGLNESVRPGIPPGTAASDTLPCKQRLLTVRVEMSVAPAVGALGVTCEAERTKPPETVIVRVAL
jgi:hypothetical protein